jgi:hypothetical protein
MIFDHAYVHGHRAISRDVTVQRIPHRLESRSETGFPNRPGSPMGTEFPCGISPCVRNIGQPKHKDLAEKGAGLDAVRII